MTDKKIKISIIFPTFNAERVIFKNLNSIQKLNNLDEIEVIIVDNGSMDSTRDIIKSFTKVKLTLIEKDSDLGFARVINIGVPLAKGEFIFLTNDDVAFPKDFFNVLLELYKKLKKDKEIIISPAVIFPGKRINYYGAKTHFLGFSYTREMYDKVPLTQRTFKTIKAAGCSIFMKRNTYLNLNGFDNYFFMYHEDTDFSLRAIRNQISIYTTNETFLHHQKLQMSINKFTYYYIERNRYLVIYKNLDKLSGLIPYIILSEFMLLSQAILENRLILRFKIYKFFIQNFRQIRTLRLNKINSKMKKLKRNYLNLHFDPIILGRVLIKVKIVRSLLKIVNLIF